MRVIFRLRATGHLTEQQVLTAARFGKDPNRFRLAPTGFRFLHDVIIKETELERLEKSRGWAARSAKVVLSVLLHMIEETEGVFWSAEIDGTCSCFVTNGPLAGWRQRGQVPRVSGDTLDGPAWPRQSGGPPCQLP